MTKIFDFETFLESVISGKSVYYFSERFRNIIDKLANSKDPVAMFIKQSEDWQNFKDDVTFIDLGETEDKVSFIQVNRLDRFRQNDTAFHKKIVIDVENGQEVKKVTPIDDLDVYIKRVWRATQYSLNHNGWKQQRTQVSVGRFVNRVGSLHQITINSEQLEKFVNSYKAACKGIVNPDLSFELVDGEIIKTYYSVKSYQERKGQLFASCMRYDSCQTFFDIYILNPEVCKLLILKGEDEGKIAGRALIWTLTSGKFYMDRQYTNVDSDITFFQNYAKEKGWDYYGSPLSIKQDLEVKIKDLDYKEYPYMDTFKYYNTKLQILSSNEEYAEDDDWWILDRTDGTYATVKLVWSELYQMQLNASDAVWAVDEDSWIHRNDAVHVPSVDEWYYSENEDDICWSDKESEYILVEDSVYSKTLGSNLSINRSVEVWINSKEQDWFPETGLDQVAELFTIDGEEKICLKSAIKQDDTGEWHFIK